MPPPPSRGPQLLSADPWARKPAGAEQIIQKQVHGCSEGKPEGQCGVGTVCRSLVQREAMAIRGRSSACKPTQSVHLTRLLRIPVRAPPQF